MITKKDKDGVELHLQLISPSPSCSTAFSALWQDPGICLPFCSHWHSGRGFANGLGDWGSIPGRVIPKTQKMVLDTSLLNTQHYKVRIMGKVEQSKERSSALPYASV